MDLSPKSRGIVARPVRGRLRRCCPRGGRPDAAKLPCGLRMIVSLPAVLNLVVVDGRLIAAGGSELGHEVLFRIIAASGQSLSSTLRKVNETLRFRGVSSAARWPPRPGVVEWGVKNFRLNALQTSGTDQGADGKSFKSRQSCSNRWTARLKVPSVFVSTKE